MWQSYTPSLVDFSFDISEGRADPEASASVPFGWTLDTSKTQLLVEPPSASMADFRAWFGYIASIGDSSSADTDSPFLVTIVAKLFFRYGGTLDEDSDSHIFARVNAFTSKAVIGKSYQSIRLGMSVCGYLAPADSKYSSAQLNCWPPSSFLEWKTAAPRSFFADGICIEHDAIYHLPLLGRRSLETSGSAYSKLLIQPDRLKLIAAHAFSLPADKDSGDAKPVKSPVAPDKPVPKKHVKSADRDDAAAEARFERALKRSGLLKPVASPTAAPQASPEANFYAFRMNSQKIPHPYLPSLFLLRIYLDASDLPRADARPSSANLDDAASQSSKLFTTSEKRKIYSF